MHNVNMSDQTGAWKAKVKNFKASLHHLCDKQFQ